MRNEEGYQSTDAIFQDVPEDIDETWHWGALIGGMAEERDDAEVARAFRQAADVLTREALRTRLPWELSYPILFTYRHAIELYLKAILKPGKRNHNLSTLVDALDELGRTRLGRPLPLWVKERLREFATFDPISTTFRYAGPARAPELGSETWVDYHYLVKTMEVIFRDFEKMLHEG